MRGLAALLGAFVGLVAGYCVGVYAGCDWLIPDSNLCGIYGVLLTGPVGAIVVGAVVWRATGTARDRARR